MTRRDQAPKSEIEALFADVFAPAPWRKRAGRILRMTDGGICRIVNGSRRLRRPHLEAMKRYTQRRPKRLLAMAEGCSPRRVAELTEARDAYLRGAEEVRRRLMLLDRAQHLDQRCRVGIDDDDASRSMISALILASPR